MLNRRERSRRVNSQEFELLESRLLLAANLSRPISAEIEDARVYSIDPSEFRQTWSSKTVGFDTAILNSSTKAIFRPAIVGGSATGATPADSPGNRVDANTPAGGPFGGVGSIKIQHQLGQFICSGVPIHPSFVLTAAHCFDLDATPDGQVDPELQSATFILNNGGNQTSTHVASAITNHPDFGGFSTSGANDDLAVMELATPLPPGTPIYKLRQGEMTAGETLELVGYGQSGFGDQGFTENPAFEVKRAGKNNADLFAIDDEGSGIDEIFLFDFDESYDYDPPGPEGPDGFDSGFLGGFTLGNDIEASVGGGDSGSPAFVTVNNELLIAGINTFEFALQGTTPDPGFLGSLGGGIIVGPYFPWIASIAPIGDNVDIELTKTESIDPVLAGSGTGNLVYTISATNNGPANATGVTIDEVLGALPAGVILDSVVPSAGTFASPTWNLGNLAASATETLTVTLSVDSTAAMGTDVITNTATVTNVNEFDTDTSNDSVTESTSIMRGVDIQLTKVESIDPVLAGSGTGNLVYTVSATNAGPSNATGVTIDDVLTLPAGVTVESVVASAGAFVSPTWNLGNLAASANETLTVTLTVAASAAAGTDVIATTATVTNVNEIDVDNSNDSASEATSIVAAISDVDIQLTKVESIDPVVAGSGTGNLVYTITATNAGPENASGITIDDLLTLPAGVTVDSVVASAGTFASPTWTLGSLAASASETLTVTLTVDGSAASGTDVIANTATLTNVNENDTDNSNDSATEATSITREVDIQLAKVESIDPVEAGSGTGNLVYTITATNGGPSNASGITIDDVLTLPTGVTVASVVASAGTFASPTWTVGNLAASASETLTVTLTVDGSAAAGTDVISNTATVTNVNETDTDNSNDSAAEATSIVAAGSGDVDIQLTKVESVDPAPAGSGAGNLVYTVTATNAGPATATGVTIDDVLTLPAGVTVSSVVASAGTFSSPTWNLGSLAAGVSETLTVTLTVSAAAVPGTDVISNTASVTNVNETDTDNSNDSVTESTSIDRGVDLEVTVIDSVDPVLAGSGFANLFQVVTVKNNGPFAANGIVVEEDLTLPPGVTRDFALATSGLFVPTTGPDGIWSLDLAPGAMASLTLYVTASASAAPGTDVILNTSTVTGITSGTLFNTANDTATEATSVEVDQPISITIAGMVPEGDAGTQVVTGTLSIDGTGPVGTYTIQTFDGELGASGGRSAKDLTPDGTLGDDFDGVNGTVDWNGTVFSNPTGGLAIVSGGTQVDFDVTVRGDLIVEGNQDLRVRVTPPGAVAPVERVVTIEDEGDDTEITIGTPATSPASGDANQIIEGGQSTDVTVTLSNPVEGTLTVDVDVADGTAIVEPPAAPDNEGDYNDRNQATVTLTNAGLPGGDALSSVVNFPAGGGLLAGTTISTANSDDTLAEGDETINLLLGGATHQNGGVANTVNGQLTIIDNDQIELLLTGPATVTEGSTANFVVELAGVGGTTASLPLTADLLVNFTPALGATPADIGVITPATLNFTGTIGQQINVSVATVDDALVEGSESFLIEDPANPGSALGNVDVAPGTLISLPASQQVEIVDNDGQSLILDIVNSVLEGNAGIQNVTGTLSLFAGAPTGTYTIETLDGEPGASGGRNATDLTPDGTVLGDDFDGVNATAQWDGTTFSNPTGGVAIVGGGTQLSFDIAIRGDLIVEGEQDFRVRVTPPPALSVVEKVVTIDDENDSTEITVGTPPTGPTSGDANQIPEGGDSTDVTVTLSNPVEGTLTVNVDVADGTAIVEPPAAPDNQGDYNDRNQATVTLNHAGLPGGDALSSVVSFPAGGGLLAGTTISTVNSDDTVAEGDETVNLPLSGATHQNGGVLNTVDGQLTIIDNDQIELLLSGPSSVDEGSSANFTVELAAIGGTTASVPFSADLLTNFSPSLGASPADIGAIAPATMNFSGTIGEQINVSVSAIDDGLAEGPESFLIEDPANPGTAIGNVTAPAGTLLNLPASQTVVINDSIIAPPPSPDVRIGGSTWAVDYYSLRVPGATVDSLPWINMDRFRVRYDAPPAFASVSLEGPVAGTFVPISLFGYDIGNNTITYALPILEDGFYRLIVDQGALIPPIDFTVLHSNVVGEAGPDSIVFNDFIALVNQFGLPLLTEPSRADLDGDGQVVFQDFFELVDDFGNELPPGPAPVSTQVDHGAVDAVFILADFLLSEDDEEEENEI